MATLEVLIPTYQRAAALGITLASLFGQTFRDFDVIVSDQSDEETTLRLPELDTVVRAFASRQQTVRSLHHLPRRGMAEQRQFLIEQAQSPYVLFLDDDLLLEPEVVGRMLEVIRSEACGFVGMAPIGLSHIDDVRPHQQHAEIWNGPVEPEAFTFDTVPWERHKLHNAANPLHLGLRLARDGVVRYKVAWVGACVMYDREKLLDVGGYSWWNELPPEHCGEDVLAQLLILSKYGGCGILPSGVYHLELPTTIPERQVNTNDLIRKLLG